MVSDIFTKSIQKIDKKDAMPIAVLDVKFDTGRLLNFPISAIFDHVLA